MKKKTRPPTPEFVKLSDDDLIIKHGLDKDSFKDSLGPKRKRKRKTSVEENRK